jgi:hypothetical protein
MANDNGRNGSRREERERDMETSTVTGAGVRARHGAAETNAKDGCAPPRRSRRTTTARESGRGGDAARDQAGRTTRPTIR